jgi:multiple sugar transport system substrate-binding protein
VTLDMLNVEGDEITNGIRNELLAEFMTANPDIKVAETKVPFSQYTAQMSQAIAAGKGVDIFQLDPTQIPELVFRDLLLPVDEFIDPAQLDGLLDIARQVTEYNGKHYSMPMWESSQVLFYNKDLLAAAGIEPPTDPESRWSWEQTLEAAKALSQPPDVFGLVIQQWNRPYQIWPLPESNGTGSVEDIVDPVELKVSGLLNSDTSVEAMAFYGTLYNEHGVSPKSVVPDAFELGKAAMYIAITSAIPRIKAKAPDLPWGCSYHPSFKTPVTPCSSWHIGIFNQVKNPDAAVKLLGFITSPEADVRWFERMNMPPVYKETYTKFPDHFETGTVDEGGHKISAWELANTAVIRPRVPGYSAYEDLYRIAIENIVNGGDAKAEMDGAAEKIDAELARYKK